VEDDIEDFVKVGFVRTPNEGAKAETVESVAVAKIANE